MMYVAVLAGVLLVAVQLLIRRQNMLLPLLVAATHIPQVNYLPSVNTMRLVLLAALVRLLIGTDRSALRWNKLDTCMLIWSIVLVFSSLGHSDADGSPLLVRLGLVFDFGGAYCCARLAVTDDDGVRRYGYFVSLLLIPLAITMALEKLTGDNSYQWLGAAFHMVRNGSIRAGGPFANAILAGTVAAAALPLLFLNRRSAPVLFFAASAACAIVIYSCSSSGPYLTAFFGLILMSRWFPRRHTRGLVWAVMVVLLLMHLMMSDPVWYLIARVDITGGSVAYHRAELITQAIAHIEQWWLVGTDYTRNWIPYGVPWSENHADITNFFLKMGIIGGLPLMLVFMATFYVAFQSIGAHSGSTGLASAKDVDWCLGASLACYSFALLGVSPYDQSTSYLYMLIGIIATRGNSDEAVVHPDPSRRSPSNVAQHW